MNIELCHFEAASRGDFCEEILHRIPLSVFIYDLLSSSVTYSNRSLIESLGYSQDSEVVNAAAVKELVHPKDQGLMEEGQKFLLHAEDGQTFTTEQRFKHADGSWRWFVTKMVIFARDERGIPISFLGISADITESKSLQEQFLRDASHDALTNLINRRYLILELERAISRGKRPLTICLCDIDYFKKVNDTYGHLVGDNVLQAFSDVMLRTLREKGIIGRLGGDEFCIVLPGRTIKSATACIQEIRKRFAEIRFIPKEGSTFSVTASFGLSEWEPGMDWKALMNNADRSLFESKRKGRDLVS
jgi:diguanylate cyclase (GGDEF)-like protein/PAS domain S-box-containing protein